MAVRYAVATGNWSNTATWNGGTLPTSADDVYANGFTVTIDQNVTVLSIQTSAQSPAVAGGGFILLDGATLTCTSATGIRSGSTNAVTYSGTTSATINSIINPTTSNIDARTLVHSGTGTLTLNGDILDQASSLSSRVCTVQFSGTGIFNINGAVNGLQTRIGLIIGGTGTCNIVGNVIGANAGIAISISGNAIVNITGSIIINAIPQSTYSGVIVASAALCVLTITGNIGSDTDINMAANGVTISNTNKFYLIGNTFGGLNSSYHGVSTSSNAYINIIGIIKSGTNSHGLASTSISAINICSGPFISHTYGRFPFVCARMHLIPSANSYFEFRDETTNGALSPGAIAPATRLVSPATAIDAPIQSNVRFGVTYGQGSLTGTLRMPTPQQVAYGVAVDNTTGSAVLTPDAVWNYLSAQLTDTGSIGARLKNVATPQTVGSQLASFFK